MTLKKRTVFFTNHLKHSDLNFEDFISLWQNHFCRDSQIFMSCFLNYLGFFTTDWNSHFWQRVKGYYSQLEIWTAKVCMTQRDIWWLKVKALLKLALYHIKQMRLTNLFYAQFHYSEFQIVFFKHFSNFMLNNKL